MVVMRLYHFIHLLPRNVGQLRGELVGLLPPWDLFLHQDAPLVHEREQSVVLWPVESGDGDIHPFHLSDHAVESFHWFCAAVARTAAGHVFDSGQSDRFTIEQQLPAFRLQPAESELPVAAVSDVFTGQDLDSEGVEVWTIEMPWFHFAEHGCPMEASVGLAIGRAREVGHDLSRLPLTAKEAETDLFHVGFMEPQAEGDCSGAVGKV